MDKRKKLNYKPHSDHEGKPRVIDCIRARANLDLVDVVAGSMNLNELTEHIRTHVYINSPDFMVILIEKRKDIQKYYSTVYSTKEDFKKKIPSYSRNMYTKKHLKI